MPRRLNWTSTLSGSFLCWPRAGEWRLGCSRERSRSCLPPRAFRTRTSPLRLGWIGAKWRRGGDASWTVASMRSQGRAALGASRYGHGRDGVAHHASHATREASQCDPQEHPHAGRAPGRGRHDGAPHLAEQRPQAAPQPNLQGLARSALLGQADRCRGARREPARACPGAQPRRGESDPGVLRRGERELAAKLCIKDATR